MINKKIIKVSKRITIILLIAIFSIVSIVACSGAEDISGSGSSGVSEDFTEIPEEPEPEKTGPVTLTTNLPTWGLDYKPEYPADSYYEIYAPFFTNTGNYFDVSYMDVYSLNKIWKGHVARTGSNDSIKWIIRDGDNRETEPRNGNYYYFDKNADIIHAGRYADKVKVKEFVGGLIVKYNQDNTGASSKVWTIGGLYRTVLNKDANNSKGQQGYAKYNNDNLNTFMGIGDNRGEGDLSIILMNVGYATVDSRYRFEFSYEFGVDEYYSTTDNNYIKDPAYFLGKNPSEYYDSKLNVKANRSGQLNKFNFRFTMSEAYSWWFR